MPPTVVLIRHAESTKNARPSFSALEGAEGLTVAGMRQLRSIAVALDTMGGTLSHSDIGFFCSPTDRCVLTATELAGESCVAPIRELLPIRSPYPGLTEAEVSVRDPGFITLISDYRNGLRSAYDIPRGAGEQVRDFEERVAAGMKVLLSRAFALSVVIGHRSTITATLLRAARSLMGYPHGWYGHVVVPLGSISVLEVGDNLECNRIDRLCDASFLDVDVE